MIRQYRNSRGFTILEVTFATGILFLSFILMTVALAQLAGVREIAERRQLAVLCLDHCLEQVQQGVDMGALTVPESLPGYYRIRLAPLPETGPVTLLRLTVTTHTSRGHEIVVSATCVSGGAIHGA